MQGVQLTTHYLGILFDQKLSLNPHIEQICDKANCFLGHLKRNLPINNSCQAIREHSYRKLILSILNYILCSNLGPLHHHNAINQIEMIQHCAAHFMLNHPWHRYHLDSINHMLTELHCPLFKH